MYTITLLCLFILASPIVLCQQPRYSFALVNAPAGTADTPTSPGVRQASCLQLKSDNSSLYMFGGLVSSESTSAVADPTLWSFNIALGTWSQLVPSSAPTHPAGRELMACWVDAKNSLNIYGGDTQLSTAANFYGDQWIYNGTSWTSLNASTNPGPVSNMAFWRISGVTYIFAGCVGSTSNGNFIYSSKLWAYSDANRNWTLKYTGTTSPVYSGANANPGIRGRMAFAVGQGNVGYIFGGVNGNAVLGDLWSYTVATNKWLFVSGKTSINNISIGDNQPPCGHSGVMVVTSNGNILLYGGFEPVGLSFSPMTYLWRYSISRMTWTLFSGSTFFTSTVTPPSTFLAYTSDLAGGAYLFGGAVNSSSSAPTTNTLYRLTFNECPFGSFINSNGNCSLCPPGTVNTKNTDTCAKCAAGSYNSVSGYNTSTVCIPCPVGTYSLAGASQCTPCPSGRTTANTGSTLAQCGKCPVGTYGNLGSCTQCPVGTIANVTGTVQCTPCPPGTSTLTKTGQTSCTACLAGQFADGGAGSCYNCPAGYFRPFANTPLGCQPCPPGQMGVANGCVTCPAGMISTTFGSANCSYCPPGSTPVSVPALPTYCRPCNPGNRADPNNPGRCAVCPSNRASASYGNQFCDYCPYGSVPYSYYNKTACQVCPLGTYHDGVNVDGCTEQDGTTGNIKPCCSPCPVGTYADTQGLKTCLPCSPGFYAPTKGSTYCLQCPLGTRSFNTTTCVPCMANTYSPGGSQWCSPTGY